MLFHGLYAVGHIRARKKSVVECFEREELRSFVSRYAVQSAYDSGEIHLTDEQQKAYDGLLEDYKSGTGKTALLYGVTGSGKTSVYLKLIDAVLADNKTVIVMVPEISLTPQTLSVFHSRYNDGVAVFTARCPPEKELMSGSVSRTAMQK